MRRRIVIAVRRLCFAAAISLGFLILLGEIEDRDARRDELAMKNEVSNWRK